MAQRRTITTELTEEDKKIETNLRPQYLKDYIGQQKIRENLKIFIDAAKARGESLDHILFMVLRDWERQLFVVLLQMRWVYI